MIIGDYDVLIDYGLAGKLELPEEYAHWQLLSHDGRFSIYSAQVNRLLREQMLAFRIEENDYMPPKQARSLLGLAVSSRDGVFLRNEAGIRLWSDITVEAFEHNRVLRLQPTDYWAGLCTNEISCWHVSKDGETVYDGLSFFAPGGVLLPLARSRCSNHLGSATLAFTRDGTLLVPRQSHKAAQNAGQLTASGAGSIDPEDADGAYSIQELVANAMARELYEECHLPSDLEVLTAPIGMIRALDRGGKPDFYGVSVLDCAFSDLPRFQKHAETIALEHHRGLGDLSADSLRTAIASARARGMISITLETAFLFLEQLLDEEPDALAAAR